MVITYSRVWIDRVWLSTLLLVSRTRKVNIFLSPFAPENLVSLDGFGSPVQRQPCSFSILRLNVVLTHGILPAFRGGVHLFIPPTAIGSVPGLSGHANAYRWRSLPRVRRHRASSPQGSSSNGCCLFRYDHGLWPIFVRLSFSTPTILLLVCSEAHKKCDPSSLGGCIYIVISV